MITLFLLSINLGILMEIPAAGIFRIYLAILNPILLVVLHHILVVHEFHMMIAAQRCCLLLILHCFFSVCLIES